MGQTAELTLYFIPSPLGIDWTTPASLAVSAVKNKFSLKPHFMGHVWVELKCQKDHELTGMISKSPDYFNQVVIKQRGLGVLFHSFDGRLEEKNAIMKEMKGYHESGGMNFARFLISSEHCQRAVRYLREYREQNVGKYYGLVNRPLYKEGSGCSAFGASFLEILGLIDEEIKSSWSQTVNIPLKFSGPPLTDKGVSFIDLMFNARTWALENEPHKKLHFWSPDLMHQWVQKKYQVQGPWKKTQIGKTNGIIFDRLDRPQVSSSIWK
jgi:hypothetical protein